MIDGLDYLKICIHKKKKKEQKELHIWKKNDPSDEEFFIQGRAHMRGFCEWHHRAKSLMSGLRMASLLIAQTASYWLIPTRLHIYLDRFVCHQD